MKKGILITFEGPEGGGKSYQIERVKEFLEEEGREILVVREPGETLMGEQIRRVLLNPKNKEMEPRAETLLFEAARAQLVEEVIKPALAQGKIVLADRFFDSTTAYQGYGRGLPLGEIDRLNRFATGGLVPDLTILLDIDPELGLERRKKSGKEDRLDAEGLEFHRRVREGYLKLATEDSQRWRVVDAGRSPDEVFEQIITIIKGELEKWG